MPSTLCGSHRPVRIRPSSRSIRQRIIPTHSPAFPTSEFGIQQQDTSEAVRWYQLAADQGYATAQDQLGGAYFVGIGVPKNRVEAMRWYRLAAEQGHAYAQMSLGIMYRTDQDYVAAYAWLNLAAIEREKADDPLNFSDDPLLTRPVAAEAAAERDEVAELMAAEQVKEGQRMARELWERIEADSGS